MSRSLVFPRIVKLKVRSPVYQVCHTLGKGHFQKELSQVFLVSMTIVSQITPKHNSLGFFDEYRENE